MDYGIWAVFVRISTIFPKRLHHRCSTGLWSQLFFLLGKELKRKINSIRKYYSNELKKSSDGKKVKLSWMTPMCRNEPISLKLI